MKPTADQFHPLYLEQTETPRYEGLWRLPLIFSLIFVGLIGASAFIRLDIVSSARGVLVPGPRSSERAESFRPEKASGQAFIFEASVENRDVGFLKIGQPVRVKVDAFPSPRYGSLSGKLIDLQLDEAFARDAAEKGILTKQPMPYRATIEINDAKLSKMRASTELREGMSGAADIITGTRTLMSYFLDPVSDTFQHGLTEQ